MANALNKWKDYFDPEYRQRIARAKVAVSEQAFREERSDLLEDRKVFFSTKTYKDLVLALESVANKPPNLQENFDAAGAYWRRDGVEEAIRILDFFRREAEVELGHEV